MPIDFRGGDPKMDDRQLGRGGVPEMDAQERGKVGVPKMDSEFGGREEGSRNGILNRGGAGVLGSVPSPQNLL